MFVVPRADSFSFPAAPDVDLKLRVHNYEFLTFEKDLTLPGFPGQTPSMTFKGHGRFVFVRSNGARVYTIVQADTASGILNDFAIVTQSP